MLPRNVSSPPATGECPRTAADLMTATPMTCSPFSTILEATVIFRDEDCRAVPVVDMGVPVGVVTDRGVALAVPVYYPNVGDQPVSEIMNRDVVMVRSEAPLAVVEEKLARVVDRVVLVTDADENVVGIITWADLIPYLVG